MPNVITSEPAEFFTLYGCPQGLSACDLVTYNAIMLYNKITSFYYELLEVFAINIIFCNIYLIFVNP
jgi:hypothetical protein